MREYKRLIDSGYVPVKIYRRFLMLENKETSLKECLLWVDIDNKKIDQILEELGEQKKKEYICIKKSIPKMN